MNKKILASGCGGQGNLYALNKALEFIKSMTPKEWQEYEKSLNLEPLNMAEYGNDNGFKIIDYSDYEEGENIESED